MSQVCEMGLPTQRNKEVTVHTELIKFQVNASVDALEYELNESQKSSLELQRKNENEWHLRDKQRSNLKSTHIELKKYMKI